MQLDAAVKFDKVGIRYGAGKEVLHDVSFSLEPGSFSFVTGVSGAGKSTLLKLLYMAERPSYGAVYILGQSLAETNREELTKLRRRVGIVFQDFRLLNHLTAAENVALPLRIAGATVSQVRDYVRELLDWVGLTEQTDKMPSSLSGGQQQRVALARAVVTRPSILLADEPTGNIDEENSQKIMYLLTELNKIGTTVIVASHRQDLSQEVNTNQLLIESGNLKFLSKSSKQR